MAPETCANCRKTHIEADGARFQACSRCRSVRYCQKSCQVADWPRHKISCRAVARDSQAQSTHTVTPETSVLEVLLDKFCSSYDALLQEAALAESGIFPMKDSDFTSPPKYLYVELDVRDDVGHPSASMDPGSVFKAIAIEGRLIDATSNNALLTRYKAVERAAKKNSRAIAFTSVLVTCRGVHRTPSFFIPVEARGANPEEQDWFMLLQAGLEFGPEALKFG